MLPVVIPCDWMAKGTDIKYGKKETQLTKVFQSGFSLLGDTLVRVQCPKTKFKQVDTGLSTPTSNCQTSEALWDFS